VGEEKNRVLEYFKLQNRSLRRAQPSRTRNRRMSKWAILSYFFKKLLLFEIPCSIFDIQNLFFVSSYFNSIVKTIIAINPAAQYPKTHYSAKASLRAQNSSIPTFQLGRGP
jgi:hypothetical protein